MSSIALKESLLKKIEKADDRLLKMIYALVEAYTESEEEAIMGYDIHGNPKTVKEMRITLQKEAEDAKAGKHISLSQLKNRSEKWLNDTK